MKGFMFVENQTKYKTNKIEKGQQKAKWPIHFISRKLFQKRPNGKPGLDCHKELLNL